ncbi:MAG TPA: thiamine ABC transporter substrate-binding protein, partial [Gordonia polyisoprenivorans]|nr:thiamine ABC transporter substrate-binding protein [Gordonia polyisoprenivorans]
MSHFSESVRRSVRAGASSLRRVGIAAVVLAAGATLVTACGDDASSSADVVMLTHDSFSLPQSVLDSFRTDTGLNLKIVKSGDAGTLASTV